MLELLLCVTVDVCFLASMYFQARAEASSPLDPRSRNDVRTVRVLSVALLVAALLGVVAMIVVWSGIGARVGANTGSLPTVDTPRLLPYGVLSGRLFLALPVLGIALRIADFVALRRYGVNPDEAAALARQRSHLYRRALYHPAGEPWRLAVIVGQATMFMLFTTILVLAQRGY